MAGDATELRPWHVHFALDILAVDLTLVWQRFPAGPHPPVVAGWQSC